mgnify:CR=1 FL=1
MDYLDFEKPIEELEIKLKKALELGKDDSVNVSKTVSDIKTQIKEKRKEIYQNLSSWQKVQLSRHPLRPYTLDYIKALSNDNFIELHGDRNIKDDKAMIGGWAEMDGKSFMFIGQQKGKNTKMRQYRNFGMPNPEGYRKALRLMKMAEKFGKPVVTFIDTPGAFPGLEAEERGQGEAIARNLIEMVQLKVPMICIIIGEGASGGDVLGGAIIGGILGKALTDNDKGAAFGAIVGAMGAAENKKTSKQIVGYQKQTKCDTVYVQEQSQQLKDYKISFQWQGVYASAYTFNHYNVGDRIPVEVRLRAK